MISDQLAEPDQDHRTGGQGQQDRECFKPVRAKEVEGIGIENARAYKDCRLPQCLEEGQRYCDDASDLIEALLSSLALRREVLQCWKDWSQELHHNRGCNIWSDAQGNERKCLQGSAGEYIQEAEQLTQVFALAARKKIGQVHLFLMSQRDSNVGEDTEDQ